MVEGRGHVTPTALATNWDAGDPNWAPTLAAEAETGLDFTPIFDGTSAAACRC